MSSDSSKLNARSYTYGKKNQKVLSAGYKMPVPMLYQVRGYVSLYITTEYPADGIPTETTLP